MAPVLIPALLAAAAPVSVPAGLPSAPANQQANDLFVRYQRIGHKGGIYLNADGSYLIVQTAPDGSTVAYDGRWTAKGDNGFCIHPARGDSPDKCVDRVPTRFGRFEHVTSSLGEDYMLALEKGR